MHTIALTEPFKLITKNSSLYPVGTHFSYTIPENVFNIDGLQVLAQLKEEGVLEYTLDDKLKGFIAYNNLDKDQAISEIEKRLAHFGAFLQVSVLSDNTPAFLLAKKWKI